MAASYISVPRDLTKVKSKVMFNLTKRQLICFGLAALIGVPSFFLLKTVVKVNTAVMGMMVIMMPFFFLAMYEKNGQPLEVILNHMIQAIFKRLKIRPYMTDNYYDALLRLFVKIHCHSSTSCSEFQYSADRGTNKLYNIITALSRSF